MNIARRCYMVLKDLAKERDMNMREFAEFCRINYKYILQLTEKNSKADVVGITIQTARALQVPTSDIVSKVLFFHTKSKPNIP